MVTWDEIISLLEQGESQSLEFEKSITAAEDIARELVAFSNSDGGKIVFGIDDKNKHLIGVKPEHNFENWIMDIGQNKCTPPIKPKIEIFEKDFKNIIVITVIEGDEKPYKTDDICYVRDGAASRSARENEEEQIKSPWGGHGLNKRQKKALQYITEHGSISNREFRELFNVSHKTAHVELTMLDEKGLVETQGSGRSTCYILSQKQSKTERKTN